MDNKIFKKIDYYTYKPLDYFICGFFFFKAIQSSNESLSFSSAVYEAIDREKKEQNKSSSNNSNSSDDG